ncbi:hypothetical protein LCGC14_3136060, partial [marine sediment metagenome]
GQDGSTALGHGATTVVRSIAIGGGATTTTAGQLVIGSTLTLTNEHFIDTVIIGNGISADIPIATLTYTSTRTNTTETDVAGTSLVFDAPPGTGAAAVSAASFRTPNVLGSGTTQQTLSTRLTLNEAGVDVGPNSIRRGAVVGSPTAELVASGTEFAEFTDASSGNVAVIASGTGGSFYLTVAAQETPTSGTPQSVNSGTATQIWGNHFAFQAGGFDNSFTYTAAKTRRFAIALNITASTATGNRTTEWFIAVNGTVLPESEMQRDHATTDMGHIGTTTAVLLSQNDRVEVFVDTTASSPTVDIQLMNLTIHAIDGT